jgi:membrane protein required for colicin V production
MNWLDITLICLVAIGFIKGLFDGFVKQVVSLLALCLGIFFCGKVAVWLRTYLTELNLFSENWITVISYVFAFVLIVGIVLLAGEIVSKIICITPLGILNHLLGGLVGVMLMTLFLSLLINAVDYADSKSNLISVETKSNSKFYKEIGRVFPTIYSDDLFTRKGNK